MHTTVHETIRIAAALGVGFALLAARTAGADGTLWAQEQAELVRLDRDTPDAVELLQLGERAMEEGDHVAAAARFAEARGFAPAAALPARRHCEALIALEQRPDAMTACRAALALGATREDERVLSALLAAGTTGRDPALATPLPLAVSAAALGLGTALLLRARRLRRGSRLVSRIAV